MTAPSERFDVVVQVLSGPLAGIGQQVLRGPVVRLGVDPGPGGLRLPGYRDVEALHATITTHEGALATIAPVGSSVVRVGYEGAAWDEIAPIEGPRALSPGEAVHLGPVGSGITLQVVRCEPRGGADPARRHAPARATPERSTAPPIPWPDIDKVTSVGCVLLLLVAASTLAGGALLATLAHLDEPAASVQVTGEGAFWADEVVIDPAKLAEAGLPEGIAVPFADFVMRPNAEAAGRAELERPDSWDFELYERVAASAIQHGGFRMMYRRLDEAKDEYATVVLALRRSGLPEVFAGIPYRESTYLADVQSDTCEKGWWQQSPEGIHRLEQEHGQDVSVRECRFEDAPEILWTPRDLAPPADPKSSAAYVKGGTCRISGCARDDRTDIDKSTAAALFTLTEAWNDEAFRSSGALVQLVIASHHAGYDDARFGVYAPTDIRPAYEAWASATPPADWHRFYGLNIRCRDGEEGTCGGALDAETQHYVYPIVARHLLAVCYYAKNYPDEPPFDAWSDYWKPGGYCHRFEIPDRTELLPP